LDPTPDLSTIKMKIEKKINILLHRASALGDVIMTTPIVRQLHQQYNGLADVYVSTKVPEVFRNNPYVKQAYMVGEVPAHIKFDVMINLDNTYENNPENYFVDTYACYALGHANIDKTLEIFASDVDEQEAKSKIKNLVGDSPYIVVHLRNWAWLNKNIDINTWIELSEKIVERWPDLKIVQVGTGVDQWLDGHPNLIIALSQFSLAGTKVLLEGAKAFIGTDSAPFHIAGATDTNIIGLLTHLKQENIAPYRYNTQTYKTVIIHPDIDCVGCYPTLTRPIAQMSCKHGDFRCNKLFDVSTILKELEKCIES